MGGVESLLSRLEQCGAPGNELRAAIRREAPEPARSHITEIVWKTQRLLALAAAAGPPGIGFQLGRSAEFAQYGRFCGELQRCGNLLQVRNVLWRRQALRRDLFFFRDHVVGDEWQIEFATSTPLGACSVVLFEELLARAAVETAGYLGEAAKFTRVELAYPAPPYRKLYEEVLQCRVMFDRPRTLLVKSRDYLHFPIKRHAWGQVDPLDADDTVPAPATGMSDQTTFAILESLALNPGEYPSLTRIAERLATSASTIKRRLAHENTSYRALVDAVRRERAAAFLAFTSVAAKEIAHQAGFTNVHNFRRAFCRWTSMTTSTYRRALDDRPRGRIH